MVQEINIRVSPKENSNPEAIEARIAKFLNIRKEEITEWIVIKRSIDARKTPVYQLRITVGIGEKLPIRDTNPININLIPKKEAIVVGAGPAGMFAALELLKHGIKPILIERGKNVKDRRRDLAAINKEHIVNPESNYCFGEGGAGTYSDGKLYTRSNKRGDVKGVLNSLIHFGADPTIAVDAHPHIGTNKLPKIIVNIREFIINNGGEVLFNAKLTDFILDGTMLKGVIINNEKELLCENLILATGHSARDIFQLLNEKEIEIENKPFALGVRIEHPQSLIDSIQYKCDERGPHLPPASYNLVTQTKFKPVYSFCMCPGGIIAPCATSPGEVVTNGWSPSRRNNPYSNSGIVVSIDEFDLKNFSKSGALAGMHYQSSVEQKAFKLGGETQVAPAQRMTDFVNGRTSSTLPKTSYQPGITSINLFDVLPKPVARALRQGFVDFGKKMRGYYTEEAVLHAVESRTSSPVKIPRDKITLEHTQINGLFPCGEGAGYAGGIMSAAIDGIKCAQKIADKLLDN